MKEIRDKGKCFKRIRVIEGRSMKNLKQQKVAQL